VSFLFPAILTIGLPLVAVPLLIHLINLRRQQRVRWAAMQFLMESQRRNRRWILLKQLLLLATRMAAVAVLVLMLAHLLVRNEWMQLLGSGTTHHLILVDDSYSMSDRWDNTSAFGEAKRAVQVIVDEAHQEADRQLATILRFSEASRLSAGAQPKVFSASVNDAFRGRLESLLAAWDTSQTDVGPAEALKAVPRLPLTNESEALILYVVSDFRARQFASASEIRKLLADLGDDNEIAQIHLVRCVQEARPNLAITALAPESGVRAAGVEMWMSVSVANYGEAPARAVTVQLEQDGDALPALALDDIAPRDAVSHKFRVQFAGTGGHRLTASLGPDAVDVDNRRYFACDLPAARPVLIIDGSQDGRDGNQLSLALAPGGNTRTGWQPHVEPAGFLTLAERLSEQAAICLLDVPRLADDELIALESYVQSGGGVAFFVGPQTDLSFYNDRLYREGKGLFPIPLELPTQLMDRRDEDRPDLEVTDHALFRVLAGRRNGFLPLILIDYYYAVPDRWVPPESGSTQVIARLRNNEPLVVEKKFGAGRIVAQLSKLSSADTRLGRWTNWSLNPAFPILANELVSYLAAGRLQDPIYLVGDELTVSAEEGRYEPTVRFFLPADPATGGVAPALAEVPVEFKSAAGQLSAQLDDVIASGIYEAHLQPLQGELEKRQFAVNVPAHEGDLAITHREELSRQLAGIDFELHEAADMTLNAQQLAGFQMTDALLGAIVVILLGEQVLAYMASFHVPSARGPSR
jgi:Aerotolerance regulator N-terminal